MPTLGPGQLSQSIEINERIVYGFSRPVSPLTIEIRMSALALPYQITQAGAVTIAPEPAVRNDDHDAFGNAVVHATFEKPLRRLIVSSYHRSEQHQACIVSAPVFTTDLTPEGWPAVPVSEVVTVSYSEVAEIIAELKSSWHTDASVTGPTRPLAEIETTRRGVCQDISRLAVDHLRRRRIPARLMVGYALDFQKPPPTPRHAWIAAHCDGAWIEFDAASEATMRFATAWGGPLAAIGPIISLNQIDARTSFTIEAHVRAIG